MVHKVKTISGFDKMLQETEGHVDIHVQRKDYGWMLSNRVIKSKGEAIQFAKNEWVSLMTSSANDNEVTRKRFYGKYFKGSPFIITIMPKDTMKGTVMFESFGKLPKDFVFREKSD